MRATTLVWWFEPEETQHLLTALGFYSGPIDGIPDRTAKQVGSAESFGIKRTGKVSSEMLVRLREEVAKSQGAAANGEDNGMNGIWLMPWIREAHFGRCDR